MNCRVYDLKYKNVVNVVDGSMLGYVCDVEIDTCNAKINSIVIYGKHRCFGLLGRKEDIIIPWCNIKIIGEDTVLVSYKKIETKSNGLFTTIQKLFK